VKIITKTQETHKEKFENVKDVWIVVHEQLYW